MLGLAGWALDKGETVADRRGALMQRLSQAEDGALPLVKLDLARFFLAQAMAAETLAVLDGFDDLDLEDGGPLAPVRQGLSGAADLLMGRLRSAEEALESEALDRDPEIALWRAVLAAAQHQWDRAARELGRSEDALASYPPALQLRLGLPAAMISLETGPPELAFGTLDSLGRLELHPSDQARLRFIRGLAHARVGQIDEAIALWRQVEGMADEETRIKAAFATATTLLEHGRSSLEEALARLLPLRPLWRGHAWEPSMLDRLAAIQAEAGDFVAAIRTWQDLAGRHPAAAGRMGVGGAIRTTFDKAVTSPEDHPLAPLRVLALVEEQPELLPQGEEGRHLRHALTGRLAGIDLIEPAIDLLLGPSAGHPLNAVDGALLASLHLRAADPNAALAALDSTPSLGIDQQLLRQRARLRARAFMELEQLDDALAAIAALDDPASSDLRADILWRLPDWPALAKTLERSLAGTRSAEVPLDRREQELVVRLAVAHAQMGAGRALADLRSRFAPAMDGTAMEPAFLLASAPRREAASPNALVSAAAREIETIRAFLDQ